MSKLGDAIVKAREAKGWDQSRLAAESGYSQPAISALETGDTVNPRNWRQLADVLDIPADTFSSLIELSAAEAGKSKRLAHGVRTIGMSAKLSGSMRTNVRVEPMPVGHIRDVPVYGRAQGGPDGKFEFNGEIIGWEIRPPQLEGVPGAYAVYVDGESMWPRYKPGETVWINPNRPARRGEDVVVQIRADAESEPPFGFIKEFVGWQSSKLVLHQWNPNEDVIFDRETVMSVHPIVMSQRN